MSVQLGQKGGAWGMVLTVRTCNVLVEHLVFVDNIVDQLAAILVHDQDLPLQRALGQRD
jgi:hypothetical protein